MNTAQADIFQQLAESRDQPSSMIDQMVSYAWTGLGASFGPNHRRSRLTSMERIRLLLALVLKRQQLRLHKTSAHKDHPVPGDGSRDDGKAEHSVVHLPKFLAIGAIN